jgi:hypothetical protein
MTREEVVKQMPYEVIDEHDLEDLRTMRNITGSQYIDQMERLYGSDIELLTEDIANGLIGKGPVYCVWARSAWMEPQFADFEQVFSPDDMMTFEFIGEIDVTEVTDEYNISYKPYTGGFILRNMKTMGHIVLTKYKNTYLSSSKMYVSSRDSTPMFVFVKRT